MGREAGGRVSGEGRAEGKWGGSCRVGREGKWGGRVSGREASGEGAVGWGGREAGG